MLSNTLIRLTNGLDELRMLGQIGAKNFTQRQQGADALLFATGFYECTNFIAERIANINGVAIIIHTADVAHPARNTQRQQRPGALTC
ncbi:hypothetical protein D3C81_2172800 [compost metagenome]